MIISTRRYYKNKYQVENILKKLLKNTLILSNLYQKITLKHKYVNKNDFFCRITFNSFHFVPSL